MMRIRWSDEARADLAELDDYYRDIRPEYAVRVGRATIAAARFLAKNPEAGPLILRTDMRKWRAGRTRYLLLHRADGEILRVVRVVHTAQDWQRFL